MSTTLVRPTLPRRLVSVVIAAMFGLTLALNPAATPEAHAAVSRSVGLRAMYVAAAQVGIFYRWGGTSPRTGFDCSGLTQYAYARVGKRLPRTAQQQYNATLPVSRGARAGDLVFFFSGRTVYHEAIYAGHGYIYHAPRTGQRVSRVRLWTSAVRVGRVR